MRQTTWAGAPPYQSIIGGGGQRDSRNLEAVLRQRVSQKLSLLEPWHSHSTYTPNLSPSQSGVWIRVLSFSIVLL